MTLHLYLGASKKSGLLPWGLWLIGHESLLLLNVLSAWRAGLVAGLRLGKAYGVFYHPGFGSVVLAPRFLGTPPPFVT